MKKRSRILCLMLSLIMAMSLVPTLALATSGSGTALIQVVDKTTNDVVQTFDTLQAFRDSVNDGNSYSGKIVNLLNNVDLKNQEWTPIGGSTNKFQGVFNGGNHIISNLVITGGNKSDIGLFGVTTDGEIKNLTVQNAKVSGRLNVGVVAGTPYTSKYSNIKVTGHVEVNGMSYVGGVGGKNAYANWTDITVDVDDTSYVNAVSTENGKAYRTYVGGVIGFMGEGGHGLTRVSCNINVIGNVRDVGGITGIAHYGNKFENVSYSGTVTNTNAEAEKAAETGLLAGVWHNEKGQTVTFTNCSSNGKIELPNADVNLTNGGLIGPAYTAANNTVDTSGVLKLNGKDALQVVAEVNGTPYATLADAIDAAQNGQTVKLLTDVTIQDDTKGDSQGIITITGNKKITIDGGMNTITVNQSNAASQKASAFNVEGGAKVVFMNLSFDGANKAKHGINIWGGEADLNNVNLTNFNGYGMVVQGKATAKSLSAYNNGWGGVNVDIGRGNPISSSEFTLESGEVQSVIVEHTNADTAKKTKAQIKGGYVGKAAIESNNVENPTLPGASLSISGGTFTNKPNEAYLVNGFEIVQYGNEYKAVPLGSIQAPAEIPQTGDDNSILLYGALMLLALAGMMGTTVIGKRKRV